MNLEQQIQEDIKAAMKAKDTVAMNAVRAIKGEQYVAAGRQELADNEQAEASVMEKYLPKQLSEAEVEAKIKEIIAQVGASSVKDMGKVMGAANKALAGLSDGRTISTIVKKLLS